MKRFHFELETVLRLASRRRDQALARVGEVVRKLEALRARDALLRSAHERELEHGLDNELQAAGVPYDALRGAYRGTLAESMRRNELDISRESARLREARSEFDDRRRELDAYEILREQRFVSWRASAEKAEQQELEEITALRRQHKRVRRSGARNSGAQNPGVRRWQGDRNPGVRRRQGDRRKMQ